MGEEVRDTRVFLDTGAPLGVLSRKASGVRRGIAYVEWVSDKYLLGKFSVLPLLGR